MKPDAFEAQMRAGEAYHGLRVPPEHWIVVRVDGRCFGRVLSEAAKPFDPTAHAAMVDVATALVREWNAPYGYTHSDEASVVLPYDTSDTFLFNRSVEKLVSVSAGLASSTWTRGWTQTEPQQPDGHFDARLWVGQSTDAVLDYFRWRQTDCQRHAIQSSLHWHLRAQGHTPRATACLLRDLSTADMDTWLSTEGITRATYPPCFWTGSGLYWTDHLKEGYNPVTGDAVWATRRAITVCRDLPEAEAYTAWLQTICPILAQRNGEPR